MSINSDKSQQNPDNIVTFPMTVIINAPQGEALKLEDELNEEVESGEAVRHIHVIGKAALLKTSHHPSAYHRNK